MTSNSTKGPVQARPGRCADHGLVQATRPMPRLRFPFIITGVMRLVAMTGSYKCPQCGARSARA